MFRLNRIAVAILSTIITTAAVAQTVTVSPASASVQAGFAKQFAASVSGTTNQSVTWYVGGVQGGNSTLGTITSGGTYLAPTCAPSSTVTITAKSSSNGSSSNAAVSVTTPSSNNYYVSTNGSDSNPGTGCRPWRTIQKAASTVSAGATVHVAPGTYSETIQSKRGGTSTSRVKFISDVQWAAKIVSSATGTGRAWDNYASYIDVEGFDISGKGAYGIKNNASYTRMIGNHIHDIPASNCASGGGIAEGGFSMSPLPSHNQYISNVFHNIGGTPGTCNQTHGLYIALPYAVAYNNISYNNVGRGIQLYHAATNAVVMNNTIFGNGWGMVIGADSAAGYKNNNTVVSNNIVYKNVNYGIYKDPGYGTGNVATNNLAYSNGTNWGSGVNHSADIAGDPQFVNPTGSYFTGNYRLKSTSPAIDHGTTQQMPKQDFTFGSRPMGNGPDAGAYEYGSSGTAWKVF